jgi:N,N'-diacetyllegionaminate synthase
MKIKKTYIIAEVGPNHQGSLSLALQYIKKLSQIGVDAVKFQIGIAEEHYSKSSFKPEYQKNKKNYKKHIIQEANKRLLKLSDHIKLYKECKKRKVDYICSAFDLISLKFLYTNTKFPFIKIPSGEIHSLDILKFISKKKGRVILSTGMATIDEIKKTLKILNNKNVILLHCVSDYPTKLNDINLRFMIKLKKIFNLTTGLSDHSPGLLAPLIATSLGAKVIEKHVTLNKKFSGPDHKTSITIDEFKKMVDSIRQTEIILGKDKKILSNGELSNKKAVRKSCIASKNILKGEKISTKSICFKRPGTGVSPLLFSKFLKKKSKKFIQKDTILKMKDFK